MSNKEVIWDAINSFGTVGIKKTDLKKKHAFEDFDIIMEELTKEDRIIVTKKGSFIYCWGKEFYLKYLLESDLKFKYLYDSIAGIQSKINNYSDSIFKYIEKVDGELTQVKNSINDMENKIQDIGMNSLGNVPATSELTLDDFRDIFDKELLKKSSSIGWIELSSIKNSVCQTCNIHDNDFYSLVGELIDLYPERYELSSGGYEGVILRGIVHGFVRYI